MTAHFPGLVEGISINSGEVKLVLWAQVWNYNVETEWLQVDINVRVATSTCGYGV